ncbi:MAG: hypothetical protein RL226_1361, partial [Bacteroidota bacterium]
IDELDFAYFGVGMILRQDGNIYYETVNSGYISRISNPDAPLNEVVWEINYIYHESVINTFPNQHHAYVGGAQLYPEGPTEICVGMTANYEVFSSGCINTDVSWEVVGDGTLENLANGQISFTALSPGDVALVASVELACGQIFDTLHVHVNPAPILDLGPNVSLCAGEPIDLDAGPDFDSYSWQDGSTNQIFTATQPGTYSVTVEKNGCQASDEVVIGSVFTPEIDLGEDIYLCDGEIVILDAGDDFTDYVWHDGSTGPLFTAFEAGLVYVTATYPCTASDTLLVTDCGQVIDNVNELNAFGDALYPNPALAEINLHLGSSVDAIQIYNAQGQRVWESGFHPTGWMTIALDAFSAGVYSITLTGNDQRVLKFVKRN